MAAQAEMRFRALQAAGDPNARYQQLRQAYNAGKELFLQLKTEMQKRDAAHAELVKMHLALTEELRQSEERNNIMLNRTEQIIRQRDQLKSALAPGDARRRENALQQKIDDLKMDIEAVETNRIEDYEALLDAQKTIKRLRKQINKEPPGSDTE